MEYNYNVQNKPDIKIFVVCHKPSFVPENPYLFPIQVGAALSKRRLDGMLHDDEGDNISSKNKSYCELTAQYWAWKNIEADYYGFFHYRRYFSFDPDLTRDDGWGNIAYERITEKVLEEIKLQPNAMRDLIQKYDVISVKGRRYPRIKQKGNALNVYQEYGIADFQHRADLDVVLDVLGEKYPEFKQVADEYMHSNVAYECNMFIMKREVYHAYCQWLFNILFEAEKRIDMTWYSVEEYRVMGYLAERLCGIYLTYLKRQKEIRFFELPKTLFHDTEPRENVLPVFENGVPIVLSANDKFSPYLDIMIRSIIENASLSRTYDIIILYNDISEHNRSRISMAAQDRKNVSIRFIRVCQYFDTEKLFIDHHLSIETYYRLIIPEIMPDYHKILYLDCDMVANRDVAELYDIDLGDCVLGAVKDIDVAGQIKLEQNHWREYALNSLGLNQPYDYFQAGVLVIDLDKLRELTSAEKLIQLARLQKWRCHDQDVLNVVCKNRIYYIPQQWNVLMSWQEGKRSRMQIMKMAPKDLYEEYTAARKAPYIVHFAGYQKPWDVVNCDMAEYFWKYVRHSLYYPEILINIRTTVNTTSNEGTIYDNGQLRKIANRILPIGTRRREVVKKVAGMVVKTS